MLIGVMMSDVPGVSKDVHREQFEVKLAELTTEKNVNSFFLSKSKYDRIVGEICNLKNISGKKCSGDYRRLKRFDVMTVDGEKKLIVPLKPGESNILYYVSNDEIFDILYSTHVRIGHGGRTRMLNELKSRYRNITYQIIMVFLSFCQTCQTKRGTPKHGVVVRPILSKELNSRCQVDLIDMQSCRDGEFRFIMVYQDHMTKFVRLEPLKTKTAEEVAHRLLGIFLLFGAPSILQSDNGREFSNRVVTELCAMWPDVKIVHGKPRHSESQGSVERTNRDVQDMLHAWMQTNDTSKWSEGLQFVQFSKNTAFHAGIRQSPYEAVFGMKAKRGLFSSPLPPNRMTSIQSEEELENALDKCSLLPISEEQEENEEQMVLPDLETAVNCIVCDEICQDSTTCDDCNLPMHESCCEEGVKLCNLCSRRNSRKRNRATALEGSDQQAEKMMKHSRNRFPPASRGDSVRIHSVRE